MTKQPSRPRSMILLLLGGTALWVLLAPPVVSALDAPAPTTESSCNFGMAKGDLARSCRVPIPPGCVVAQLPGTTRPWSNLSKGGTTACRFDGKETDWKTRITGTCTRCASAQCTARFGVMLNCPQGR